MASLEHFDLLLGECLERLIAASDEIRVVDGVDEKPFVMQIGRVVGSIWDIRDDIYEIRPDLKRDFVEEREADRVRFEELNALNKDAITAEKQGDMSTATSLYRNLLGRSDFGYFKLIAEAGLFRTGRQGDMSSGDSANSLVKIIWRVVKEIIWLIVLVSISLHAGSIWWCGWMYRGWSGPPEVFEKLMKMVYEQFVPVVDGELGYDVVATAQILICLVVAYLVYFAIKYVRWKKRRTAVGGAG